MQQQRMYYIRTAFLAITNSRNKRLFTVRSAGQKQALTTLDKSDFRTQWYIVGSDNTTVVKQQKSGYEFQGLLNSKLHHRRPVVVVQREDCICFVSGAVRPMW